VVRLKRLSGGRLLEWDETREGREGKGEREGGEEGGRKERQDGTPK
jgi:hypothetical protein